MKRLTFLGCLLAVCLQAWAQTSREELLSHLELTAGNYANYPVPTTLPTLTDGCSINWIRPGGWDS